MPAKKPATTTAILLVLTLVARCITSDENPADNATERLKTRLGATPTGAATTTAVWPDRAWA